MNEAERYRSVRAAFLAVLSCTVILVSCSGTNDPGDRNALTKAFILGPDLSMSVCSGGYFIAIDDQRYRCWELPHNDEVEAEIARRTSFPFDPPIAVRIEWTKPRQNCSGMEIEISRIELDN